MNNETEPINKSRKPTKVDRAVLAYLQEGGIVSHIEIESMFGSTQSRDIIWRLRLNGNPYHIQDEIKYRTNAKGEKKKFKIYFIKPPEIIPTGKTVETNYRKEKSSTQFANEIIETAKNYGSVQQDLFSNASVS